MRAVVQRVKSSSVSVDNIIIGSITKGINVLLAVKKGDSKESAEYIAKKIMQLRIFSDRNDKMNLSVQDIDGEILVISQFTLYGDCNKGNRPSYIQSAVAEEAKVLYEYFINFLKYNYNNKVESGDFQTDMTVFIENDGPVTLIVDSRD